MARHDRPVDPYAAPHAPKERSGPLLRIGIIAVLLGGAALAWNYYSDQAPESAGLTPAEQAAVETPVQVADAGPAAAPEAAPAAESAPNTTQTTPPAPAPAPRRSAPAPAPVENVPPPSTTIEPSAPAPSGEM